MRVVSSLFYLEGMELERSVISSLVQASAANCRSHRCKIKCDAAQCCPGDTSIFIRVAVIPLVHFTSGGKFLAPCIEERFRSEEFGDHEVSHPQDPLGSLGYAHGRVGTLRRRGGVDRGPRHYLSANPACT